MTRDQHDDRLRRDKTAPDQDDETLSQGISPAPPPRAAAPRMAPATGAPPRNSGVRNPLPVVPTRHCWEIIKAPDNDLHGSCDECYAYFAEQDCWTLWALRDAGHKPCCQKKDDCATCPVLLSQIGSRKTENVQIRAQFPAKPTPPRTGSAKQVCGYLEPIDVPVGSDNPQYLSAVSRAIQARSSAFRCRLRGVHLDVGYVADMCVSRHIADCIFLEEAHPEVSVQTPEPVGSR